jgi:hypothetical protein
MRQALHILNKDLRALRLPLLLLYAVMAVEVAGALRDPLLHDPVPGLDMVTMLLPLALLVAAALLVQQEALVGTRAFWLTRPIERGSLLLSKAIFLVVFMLTPAALATIVIALAYGAEPAQAAAAVSRSLAPLGSLLLSAVLLAALTPNLPACITAWIALLLGSQLLGELVGLILPAHASANSAVETAALLLCGAALILHQYFTRRTRRTLAGLGAAWLICSVGLVFLPWGNVEVRDPTLAEGQVVLALKSGTPDGDFYANPQLGRQAMLTATPQVLHSPPGVDVAIQSLGGELRLDKDTHVALRGEFAPVDAGGIEAAMPGFRWIGNRHLEPATLTLLEAGKTTLDQLLAKPATLAATLEGQLYAYRLAGTLALEPGSRFEKRTAAALVQSVTQRANAVRVVLRVRDMQIPENPGFPRILLVNRRRGEMLEGEDQQQSSIARLASLLGPAVISASEQAILFASSSEPNQQSLDQDWLRDAELAFLERVPAGYFRTQIEVKDFRITDKPFARRAAAAGATE